MGVFLASCVAQTKSVELGKGNWVLDGGKYCLESVRQNQEGGEVPKTGMRLGKCSELSSYETKWFSEKDPSYGEDIIAVFEKAKGDARKEYYMLGQIQNAGFAPPNLYKLDPQTGDFESVKENIDCGMVRSLKIKEGELIFDCNKRLMSKPHEVKVTL